MGILTKFCELASNNFTSQDINLVEKYWLNTTSIEIFPIQIHQVLVKSNIFERSIKLECFIHELNLSTNPFPLSKCFIALPGICHHHPSGLSSSKIYFIYQSGRSRIIFIFLLPSGNILSVWIFNKKDVELKPSFANLLKCLSVFDTIFLVRGLDDQCVQTVRD